MPKNIVAVVSTTPETVLEDIPRALILAGARKHLVHAERLLLKLQLDWDRSVPGVNTQPWQLEGALRFLRGEGLPSDRLLAVENRKPLCDPQRALVAGGLDAVLRRHAVTFRSLEDLASSARSTKGTFRVLPQLVGAQPPLPEVLDDGDLLLLPTLKTHPALSISAGVAALWPLCVRRMPPLTVQQTHELAVDLVALLRERDVRCFTLIDATVCGDGSGPRTIRPSLQNVLIASADPVAADAVAAALMGLDPWSVPYLRWASEAHLGQARLVDLDIAGEDITTVDFGLRPTRSPAHWGELRGNTPWSRGFHGLLSRLPLGRVYQNALWFPWVGTRLRRHYLRTPWGRLARHYQRDEIVT